MGTKPSPLVNPTSGRRTFWQITLIMLMAVNYLLDHDPRHVKITEARRYKKAQASVAKYAHLLRDPTLTSQSPLDPRNEPLSTDSETEEAPRCPSPRLKERWLYPRIRQSFRNASSARSTGVWGDADGRRNLSKMDMSDAWMRMRSVTRIPVEFVKVKKAKKKVRWGHIDVIEYDLDLEGIGYGDGPLGDSMPQ